MPKIKTHKATSKRIKKSGKGKLMRKKTGQDHFNSRDTGVTRTRKRRSALMSDSFAKTIHSITPGMKRRS